MCEPKNTKIPIVILLFRYILILYSDRGLVKNGKVNVLFTILYVVLVTAMMSWSLTLQIVYEFGPKSHKNMSNNEIQMICENIEFKEGLKISQMVSTILRNYKLWCTCTDTHIKL